MNRIVGLCAIVLLSTCKREPGPHSVTQLAAGGQGSSPAATAAQAGGRSAVVTRRVWSGEEISEFFGGPSPDGRYLTFTDWTTGDLALRELATGANRRVTNKGTWSESNDYAEYAAFSPDGRQIAYAWWNGDFYELRVIGHDGSGMRSVLRDRALGRWLRPNGWSPDGRWVVATLIGTDGDSHVALVAADGAARRIVKSFDWRWPAVVAMSPDGRWIAFDRRPREKSRNSSVYLLELDGGRETRLTQAEADESLLGWLPDGSGLLIARSEGGSSNVWRLSVTAAGRVGQSSLVRRDLFEMEPMGFSRSGFFYGVTTSKARSYGATIDVGGARISSAPVPLEGAERNPAWSPDGSRLAYTIPGNPLRIIIRSLQSGEEVRQIVPIELRRVFDMAWTPDGNSLILNGQRKDQHGVYQLDLRTHAVKPFAQTRGAATSVLSPDGRTLYYHAVNSGPLYYPSVTPDPDHAGLYAQDVRTGEERQIFSARPDNQGLAISPDGRTLAFIKAGQLLALPTTGGEPRVLVERGNFGWGDLAWTPDGRWLLYVVNQFSGGRRVRCVLRRVAATGGESAEIMTREDAIYRLRLHPDGRRIAFESGEWAGEVWVMENLPAAQGEERGEHGRSGL